ncbi:hypothetical protein Slin14017_G129640 [Septoria linicola]|nr:hypothetical protein Slin14017_G129640 [Septoria linicola]
MKPGTVWIATAAIHASIPVVSILIGKYFVDRENQITFDTLREAKRKTEATIARAQAERAAERAKDLAMSQTSDSISTTRLGLLWGFGTASVAHIGGIYIASRAYDILLRKLLPQTEEDKPASTSSGDPIAARCSFFSACTMRQVAIAPHFVLRYPCFECIYGWRAMDQSSWKKNLYVTSTIIMPVVALLAGKYLMIAEDHIPGPAIALMPLLRLGRSGRNSRRR